MTRPVAAIHSKHILTVAAAIASRQSQRDGTVGFNMSYFTMKTDPEYIFARDEDVPDCNTVACMAGWSRIIRTNEVVPRSQTDFPWREEAEAMGLTETEGYALFYSTHLSALQAVAVLVLLSQGHEVAWAVEAASGRFDEDLLN